MGRNGMGKTTLFKSLMGMLPLKSGSIAVGGQDISKDESYSASPRASPTCRRAG
jgi:urea transport system ATP-binding protein